MRAMAARTTITVVSVTKTEMLEVITADSSVINETTVYMQSWRFCTTVLNIVVQNLLS